MGRVLTINKKNSFPENLEKTIETATKVKIDGFEDRAQTKFMSLNETVGEYGKYKIEFMKKCRMSGIVQGIEFESFLRKYETYAYENKDIDYVFTLGNTKGTIPANAFKRLKNSEVKCSSIKINLGRALELIKEENNNVSINSTWFSNLGVNLNNAWLQGNNVDFDKEFKKFIKTEGAQLKNIELKIEDDSFEENGYIFLSLSSRGFLHTNNKISDEKFLEITNDIINIIEEAIEEDINSIDE
ncbi:hypothetical protein [Clostridium perfringens]|uniref:hypothetical protein n=1 Tax=Clostridium perfringens TaxID=1502 RepID=UPI001242BED9|nr:hypothetical protein [Clostridium perfringens]EHK2367346.1 hypothetical protein [Clostridium perfringens]MDK0618518.1 hypothetical protein [Clostridium perfringens]MDM0885882.1 hypothetical protein [Clostridium perfringens]MDU4050990.1 hypothetical protein [Clostridium perfringens]